MSAILPWPQLMYAPSKDWFVSLGASYSGNSWAVNNATGAVGLNLSGFDFGFGGGMRLKGPLWLEGAVGVGGLRALTITDGDVSGPSIDPVYQSEPEKSFLRTGFAKGVPVV